MDQPLILELLGVLELRGLLDPLDVMDQPLILEQLE
jgi:hypothetical protein